MRALPAQYLNESDSSIMHRDVKSSNILVQCKNSNYIHVKFEDFDLLEIYDCLVAAKFLATRISGEEVLSFATGIFFRGVVLLQKWLCCNEQGNPYYCKNLIPY